MQAEAADDVRLWWERAGDGPVVLLVPGSGDCSDIFPGSFTRRLVDGGCSVLRFDQRDTGRSDDGGDEYTLRTMAEDTIAVLDAAGVERAHVVGISMAGMLMADVASTHPERVASLTFVSAMSPDPDAGMGPDFFATRDGDRYETMLRAMGDTSEGDRAWLAELLRAADEHAPVRPEAVARHMAAAFRFGWIGPEVLASIRTPTTVVHGHLDQTLPTGHADALAHGIDGATLVLRVGMGHLPRPDDWDEIARRVLDLVGRTG
jgi:pimeloyl-ACP methyl ester carboxylesterase